jgi:hypothetical protein
VGATISVQKSETGAVIASELPHLEHILQEQKIPMAHLNVQQSGAGMSQSQSHSQSQSQGQTGGYPKRTPWTGLTGSGAARATEAAGSTPEAAPLTGSNRLNIRV